MEHACQPSDLKTASPFRSTWKRAPQKKTQRSRLKSLPIHPTDSHSNPSRSNSRQRFPCFKTTTWAVGEKSPRNWNAGPQMPSECPWRNKKNRQPTFGWLSLQESELFPKNSLKLGCWQDPPAKSSQLVGGVRSNPIAVKEKATHCDYRFSLDVPITSAAAPKIMRFSHPTRHTSDPPVNGNQWQNPVKPHRANGSFEHIRSKHSNENGTKGHILYCSDFSERKIQQLLPQGSRQTKQNTEVNSQ